MKGLLIRAGFISAVCTLLFSSVALSLPINEINDGDQIKIYDNPNYGTNVQGYTGGEFKIDVLNEGVPTLDFISFCLEVNEHIQYNTIYFADGAPSSAAEAGGLGGATDGKDPISQATAWLFYTYLYGNASFSRDGYTGDTNINANAMQELIWYLEDEVSYLTSGSLSKSIYDTYLTDKDIDTYTFSYYNSVKVLNLRATATDGPTLKQSQLIAEPVPEPATMLLFGTGLVGLAGVARRKIAKK